jgi:hypothetical protein
MIQIIETAINDFDNIPKEINIPFDFFWDEYDKKRGDKVKLQKKWSKLTDEERNLIIDYIPKYKLSQPEKKFRKDPDTFLNNKSWNDELIESGVKETYLPNIY